MQRKNPLIPAHFSALFTCSLIGIVSTTRVVAQAPPPAPPPVVAVAPATLNRIYSEAEAAFGNKDYDTAVAKIRPK